jgi:hypothetical protein
MATELNMLFWLNKAKKDKHDKSPLIIWLTYKKQRKQLTTKFKLREKDWSIIEIFSFFCCIKIISTSLSQF